MKIIFDNRATAFELPQPSSCAVLAIHFQNDVLSPRGAFGPAFATRASELGLVSRVEKLLNAARTVGMTVVYANVTYTPGHPEVIRNSALFVTAAERNAFVRGTTGAEVVDELTPQPSDFIIEHSRISCFWGTDLETILRARGITHLLVTGIATNVAVDHTVRDAVQMGFKTVLVEDCCCSSSSEFHEASLMTLNALSTHVVRAEDVQKVLA